jgi:hypothetical protein
MTAVAALIFEVDDEGTIIYDEFFLAVRSAGAAVLVRAGDVPVANQLEEE